MTWRAGVGEIVFNWFIWFQEMGRLKFIGQDSIVKFHISIDVIVLNAMKTGNSGRIFVLQCRIPSLLGNLNFLFYYSKPIFSPIYYCF